MGEIVFLGTGSAWRIPEHNCECLICRTLRAKNEQRTRSSIMVNSRSRLLIDCGPDLLDQMKNNSLKRPDAVLITHEHGDHFLGMDELLAFKRTVPNQDWIPIPVYATKTTWDSVESKFSYLLGPVIEKKIVTPSEPIDIGGDTVTPFKTDHGKTAPGSVGYVIESRVEDSVTRIVYTSDFVGLPYEPEFIKNPNILIFQTFWLNEPDFNRPSHMSLQRGIDYIKRWEPLDFVYLTHISASDIVDGDPSNNTPKKLACSKPLLSPATGAPYPTPCCQTDWEALAARIRKEFKIVCDILVPYDGLRITF